MTACAKVGKDHLSTGQIAKLCRVAPRTVSKWVDSGKLVGYRIPLSQDRRVPRANLIRFLKEHGIPLGHLEHADQYHTVAVGLVLDLRVHLSRLLPESERFFWQCPDSGLELGLLLSELMCDAMVIDLAGNRGEGLHTVRRLRTMPEYRRLEIVGIAAEDETADLLTEGFSMVYRRPFDVALLANWLRSLARVKWGLDARPVELVPVDPAERAIRSENGRAGGKASAAKRRAQVA